MVSFLLGIGLCAAGGVFIALGITFFVVGAFVGGMHIHDTVDALNV